MQRDEAPYEMIYFLKQQYTDLKRYVYVSTLF